MGMKDRQRRAREMTRKMVKENLRAHLSNHRVEDVLRKIIAHIADSAKYIAFYMEDESRRLVGRQNAYGEHVLALDEYANVILKNRLEKETSFGIRQFASEELDTIKMLGKGEERYSVTVDPLDGSSLVDSNLAVGTIVGIHAGKLLGRRSGRKSLAAAMYIIYGPLTTLVYTVGDGAHEFVLDKAGNFVLSQENLRMKRRGAIYGPGGLKSEWLANHAAFIKYLEQDGYKLRYSGALVPDVNQIIIKQGGVFCYPALKSQKEGKLRLLFEEQPLAMIAEACGGLATDGQRDTLDIVPCAFDQRAPFYFGSRREIEMAHKFLAAG
jgi:fructose-1,6-bisphosphatase I